jgi:transposase-like protein DUF772
MNAHASGTLIAGYCYGIRFERRLSEEIEFASRLRCFCCLDLEGKVPDHSTCSVNRHASGSLEQHRESL